MNATRVGYSHIVAGAGAAGCVLASRLSEDRNNRILLIEAGKQAWRDPTLRVPMMTALLLRGNRHVWKFTTADEPGLGGRRIDIPRGKVVGGSTAINGMVYVRGLPEDYDLWAQAGMPGWSWRAVRDCFLRSENFLGPGPGEHHATNGPLSVSRRPEPVSPLANIFVEAGIAAGYPHAADFNSPDAEGFGLYHFTIKNGRRESAATAFLGAARARPNLDILSDAEVNRCIIQNGRATGIEIVEAGRPRIIETDGEVILSAGVFGTPSILLRSGIGPADELRALDIEPVLDRSEVGRNLQDHLLIRVSHATSDDVSLHKLTRIDRAAIAFLRAWLTGGGPMNVFPLEAGAYIRSAGSDLPTIQSHFMPALTSATLRFNPFADAANTGPGFMANASVMRPASRGRLQLRSKDPAIPPEIRFNYLSDPRDSDLLVEAVGILRDVFAQKPFDPWRGVELGPGPDIKSHAQIAEWVRATASTMHHACGSCRMGADDGSVVDPELCVRGVEGLHIADASIFPAIPSTNTAAPTMMVAEKAAEIMARASKTASVQSGRNVL